MQGSSYLNNYSGYRANSSLLGSNSSSNLLANKFNQTMKQNNPSGIQSISRGKQIGLNPNLNIEDEYAQNLMKQIHFMNMEIKLLKEKQSQSQNNAIWGIVNRTNQPMIKNIVDSSEKYQDMKNNMDSQNEQLTAHNIRLGDMQNAILKEYQYLEAKLNGLRKRKEIYQGVFKERNSKVVDKISQQTNRLKQLQQEKQIQRKRYLSYINQIDLISTEGQIEQSKMNYQLKKIRNDEIIEEQMQKQKIIAIEEIQNQIKILREKFESNVDYQHAQQEQTQVRQKIGNLEKNISGANFQLMQLDLSIKMAQSEKQKEIRQRKELTEELQSLKTMLTEITLLNMGRLNKESELRRMNSSQIQKAEYLNKKLEKNLQDIKKKLNKSEDTQNHLRLEVQGLERQLTKNKEKRQSLRAQLQQLTGKNQTQDKTLTGYENQLRKNEDIHQKVSHEELLLVCELQSVQKQIQSLRGRKDYLNESLNLKDTLNATKLQDLQRVVQKNIDLNETVSMVMGKWEEIKTFSRM